MINYALVITATVLFSLQFLFNQRFQQSNGTDLKASLVFSLYKSIVIIVIMLFIAGFRVGFTWFSLLMATVYSVSGILMSYYSLKAFSVANLSVFSVFSMLGGMLLPFLLGVIFYGEPLTVFKVICCILIVGAVLLNVKTGKQNRKGLFYCFAVFFLNGMAGVISKIHQSAKLPHVDSTGFMIWSSIVTVVICAVWLLVGYKKIPLVKGKDIFFVSGYGVFNGVGNLFLLIALSVLPASIQYPLVTGGVMVCATVISAVRKEKLKLKDYVATGIALLASIFIAI
ncbi:MAG: EamA family transporter [Clostridia bacterium]|nr:EamA family transporter [Clostridia bacterium]